MTELINVEIIYALPERAIHLQLKLPPNSTIEHAISQSKLLDKINNFSWETNKVGIFGKLCKQDYQLREGDRIEIYRPLIADPKEIRRQRAAAGKEMKKNSGDIQ